MNGGHCLAGRNIVERAPTQAIAEKLESSPTDSLEKNVQSRAHKLAKLEAAKVNCNYYICTTSDGILGLFLIHLIQEALLLFVRFPVNQHLSLSLTK